MCNTYPKTLIVPAKCDDQMLIESSRFRNGGRFPLLVYYHKPRQTTLLITAEPITTQFINVSNQNTSTQLSSNPSSSVLSTIANSSFTTSLTSSKSSNLILNSSIKNSISPFNSTSNNRCRADEQLLSFVLPDKCRGVILDLRSQSETKKPQVTSGQVEFEQYYPQWRRVCRPVESTVNLINTFRKFIYACTSSGRLTRSPSNSTFSALHSGISDSIGLLSNAALNPIGNFGLRNVVTTTNSSSISFDNSSINSLNNINEQQINTTVKNDIISNLNQLDIQSTNYTTVESNLSNINNNSNNSNINVKKSKKFSAWLSLVREALAAAVAGATALDALDAFAQQQLQQEQCLLAEKQKKSSKVHVNEEVKLRGSCVLVQSRKGTDRAILVASLIQIILNPECRTIQGFQTLIDHTWLQAGHPFTERCQNSAFSLKPLKNESPVFILFLDCVWQLLRQYPNSFEFTDELLCVLAKHAYFSEYGTFLGNSSQEREQFDIPSRTISLWSYINQPIVINCFQNPFYSGQNNDKIQLPIVDGYACWPCLAAQALDVWEELYQQQLVGDNPGLWKLPRYMSHVIVDKFETERLRSIQLRKTLNQLINEAVAADILHV
ncbi:Myotubularin-related protein [Schistosoma japonicum]|uniref:Myotubularin-related protein n=1 Tax=Schistosoma japonicum TaxID=6182 RepID=A0A4Z2CWE4_SCHJA|nr:Myotubularin-related protein [Schistosoma japonicum]